MADRKRMKKSGLNYVLLALLALGNLSFWLCDRALTAITPLYRQRIAPRLKKKF